MSRNIEAEIKNLLRYLKILGVMHYECDELAQAIRDDFPNGVNSDVVNGALDTLASEDEFYEMIGLQILAMVPIPEIEPRVAQFLNRYKDRTDLEGRSYRSGAAHALCYLSSPEGEIEIQRLRQLKIDDPPYGFKPDFAEFDEFDAQLAKWRADRAAGRRWEPED
jgi:hypothetical protein